MNTAFTLHSKTHRSFKHLATLQEKLVAAEIADVRHILCKTVDDRWTVVFVPTRDTFHRVQGSGYMVCLA